MTQKMGIAIATFALAAASASSASAQMMSEGEMAPRGPVRAPANAFELDLDTGYTQGFGPQVGPTPGTDSTGLGGANVGFGLGLGYRATPYSSVRVAGTYNMQNVVNGTSYRGATVGVDAAYHAIPFERLDPWVSIGAGYRMLWEQPQGAANDDMIHGFQLARAKVGLDIRVSDSVSLAPTVGGDLNLFVWRNPEGRVGNQVIQTPRINTFVFAGIQGRFDMAGRRVR
jgi:opacity protein-like surface antigen